MKKINTDYLINWWLEKYHNTDINKVKKENPEWANNPSEHSRDFYMKYKVTQEQHDEWEAWAKKVVKEITGLSKKVLERSWWSVYLNTSPSVINKD